MRIVPLAVILKGLEENWEGLKAGEYIVELRLGAVTSNHIKLRVVKPSVERQLINNPPTAVTAVGGIFKLHQYLIIWVLTFLYNLSDHTVPKLKLLEE